MSVEVTETGLNLIPAGYKQTEVGVIPEDWVVLDFGSMFQRTISKKFIKPNSLVSFVGMQDVTEQAQLSSQHLMAIEDVKNGFTYFERGDILVAKITPCFENGKGCHTESLLTCIGFGSTEFHVLRATNDSDSKFIYYWSNRDIFRQSLESEMVGSAGHRRVPLSAITNYQIPIPPLKEQSAIADVLSDVDALISELEKLITKKQDIKTATMQQLLTGRTRLPQFALREDGSKKGTKQSVLGEIPEDWKVISIAQDTILKARIGWQALTTKEYQTTGDIYLVTGTDFDSGVVKWERCFYVSEWRYKQDQNIQLKNDDLLITKDGTIGKVGYVAALSRPATLNSGIFVIRPRYNNLIPRFLFYVLTSRIFDDFINRITAGSTITHLYQKDFVNFEFSSPNREEQTTIAAILSDMDEEIQALEQRLSKTRQIKQGMMQELLTGKTRLI